MTHLFQPQRPFYKEPAFAFAVTAVLVLGLLFGATSCQDKDPMPTPEEMIKGAWVRTWTPVNATTTYSFDGHGQCIAHAILPSQPVQIYTYAYSFDGDTITMINLASAEPFENVRRAVVSFPDGETAVLAWLEGVDYKLKRM